MDEPRQARTLSDGVVTLQRSPEFIESGTHHLGVNGDAIVVGCHAERVAIKNNVAIGLEATVNGHRLAVRSKIVVGAAWAHTVGGPSNSMEPFSPGDGGDGEAYLHRVARRGGVVKNDFGVYTAHQMSSCRMGRNPDRSPVDPQGETYEVENLFAADGSALPSATGVNAMISIMALAHRNAQIIKARL